MDKLVINIKKELGGYDFAGSRGSGEIIRKKIKPVLDKNEQVVLDFAGMRGVTQAFADEIFGIFVRAFGIGYVKNKLFIANATQGMKDIINYVILYSNKKRKK